MQKMILPTLVICFLTIGAVSAQDPSVKKDLTSSAPVSEYAFEVKHGANSPANYGKDAFAITNTSLTGKTTWAMHVSTNEKSLQFFLKDALELKIMPDGSLNTISDRNRKYDISTMRNGQLEKVLQLQPRQYKFIGQDDNVFRYGFVAQETNSVYPELVNVDHDTNGKETWTMNYPGLIPFMVKAMQEQQSTINVQNSRIEHLEANQAALELRLQQLESILQVKGKSNE